MKQSPAIYLIACLLFANGCTCTTGSKIIANPVVAQQNVPGVGACQGIAVIEGSVWLYGDKNGQGVIKRMSWAGPDAENGPGLIDTGEIYELTLYRDFSVRNQPGVRLDPDPMPHPTGLTHHPELGTFIGNTVNQQGTIYQLFWEGFTESGNLDSWVRSKTLDDLATYGTRPEFVRYNGRWLIATADAGDKHNKLRLYDPRKLAEAKKTSEPGVLVAEFDGGPFVQSLHWIDADNTLVLAQNRTADRGYRLTLMKFGEADEAPQIERVIDFNQSIDALTGFAVVAPGWAVMTSAVREDNVTIIRWPIQTER